VDSGLAASTIRQRLGIVKRMVGWGVANEKLPGDALYRLQAVPRLKAGKKGPRPAKKVRAAPEAHIRAILPQLNPVVRAMVQIQDLTGARPGEIRSMTTGEIDRTVDPWLYRPAHHKTEVYEKDRVIPIGPKGQEVLKSWLKDDPGAPIFSPVETMQGVRTTSYSPKRTDRQRAARRKPQPKRRLKDMCSKGAYRWAIERACDKAGVSRFTPNQIRHTAATRIRRLFGLEAAQTVLGHAKADVTQIYAERNLKLAEDIAMKIG
jgi:integrase